MPFVAARCPQCGGEIQVDNQKDSGFCLHCGSKILVQEAIRAVQIDNSHMVDTWMKLGKAALEANNYSEAYEYYTRVLEVKPDDWFATLYKGYSAGLLSTWEKPRIDELIYGIQKANALIDKTILSEEDKIAAKNLIPPTIIGTYQQYLPKVLEVRAKTNFGWLSDDERKAKFRQVYEKAIDNYQMVLSFVNEYEDRLSKENKLNLKIQIIEQCINVCWPFICHKDQARTESFLWGYTAEQKKKFVNLYDNLLIEVLYERPNYKPGHIIDRLSPPPDVAPEYERVYNLPSDLAETINSAHKAMAYYQVMIKHNERVEEAEKKAEKIRKIRLEEYKKNIYWKDHPEEYQKHKEQELKIKLQQDEKVKDLRSQKGTIATRVDEIEKEISKLQLDRSKLGLFDGKAKKLIDEKILLLQNNQRTEKTEIDKLNKAIESLTKKNNAGYF